MDIIIVDDDVVSVTMLKHLVEKLPECNVREFVHPVVALAWCQHNETDLIIVDHLMPGLDGIVFTRRLREFPACAQTPVLMVTASDEAEVRSNALQAGVNEILIKPFSFDQLQPLAARMLASRRAHKSERAERAAAPRKGVLDMNMTLQRLAGDQTLLGNLAVAFIRTAPQLLASISAALAASDLRRASVQAHALRGAVAAFEAPVVSTCVLNVEKHAKSDNAPAAAAAFRLAQDLVERLLAEVVPLAPPDAELDSQH
ncbi:MAG: response regulator [Burkholderiales bacterium]